MVGSSIVRALKEREKKIRLYAPTRKNLDLTCYRNLDKFFELNRPEIVIIAAAKVGGIYANKTYPYNFILDNLKIQTNLIELSFEYGVQKLIFLGSSCIYPKFAPQPIKEEALLSGPLERTNEFYALAKIAGIKLCESLYIQHKFKSISLMPTNLYGPGDNYHYLNSHVLPAFIRKFFHAKNNNLKTETCWGSGESLREFLYVDDLADACLFVLDNWERISPKKLKNQQEDPLLLLNIGSGCEISIKELAYKISKEIGYKGKILWDKSKPDGTPRKILNSNRINELGWKSKVSLSEGIKLTLESFKKELLDKNIRI